MPIAMDKDAIREFIAARVAKELHDGEFVNLGIGLPTLVPNYLSDGVRVTLGSENGIVGAGPCPQADKAEPRYVVDAGGQSASCARGGAFIDSATSFGLIRGGHLDTTVLGALQVDQEGNLANWIIPGKMVPGMGGAMDLVVGARKVIVAMEHTQKGAPKILKKCTLPLTALNCVDLIVTQMCVMAFRDGALFLQEINAAFTVAEVVAATARGACGGIARTHDRPCTPCYIPSTP
jgi:acetate CoA/acetoacetate CoA-transferase beta subunit